MKSLLVGALLIFAGVAFGQIPGLNAKEEAERKSMVTRYNKAAVHYLEIWEATKNERGYPRKDLSDKERYALLFAALRLELAGKEGQEWLTWYKAKQEKENAAKKKSTGAGAQ